MTIKAFPMDSKVTEMGEDGLPVYDRAFDSSDLREVTRTFFSSGYFAEDGTSLNVKAASGLDVTVQAGKANLNGVLGYMDEDATVRLSNADKTYARIDTIVARLDLSIDKRSVELYAKSGNASSVPARPSLERTETVWELGLADVTLAANATEVTDADIADTRLDADRCGVAEPFAKLDTESLFEQVTAIVTQAKADIKADTDALATATADAVSAMDDALSSTVLGSVARLQSTASGDYLAYGDDLNSIANVGSKFCDSASVAGGILNKPSEVTGPFALHTFATEVDPSRLGQVLSTCDSNGVQQWTRSGAGNSWTAWESARELATRQAYWIFAPGKIGDTSTRTPTTTFTFTDIFDVQILSSATAAEYFAISGGAATFRKGGLYELSFKVTASTGGREYAKLLINGTSSSEYSTYSGGLYVSCEASAVVRLTAGDTLTLSAVFEGSSPRSYILGGNNTALTIRYLG